MANNSELESLIKDADDLINTVSKLDAKEWENYKKLSNIDKSTSKDSYIKSLEDKKSKYKSELDEATTTSAVPGVMTPFAFSTKDGNTRAATQLGYKLAKIKRSRQHKNDQLKETIHQNEDGLVQHNDPNMDPNLVTYKDTTMPTTENEKLDQTGDGKIDAGDAVVAARKAAGMKGEKAKLYAKVKDIINKKIKSKLSEGLTGIRLEQEGDAESNGLSTIDVQADFTAFDQKLKSSTEALKIQLQNTLNKKLLGKQVVVRAAKGYKQPESDYTVNVTGVEIDYYYDKYVIVIVGRQENKQKSQRFFIKPGFKIKVLGDAELTDAGQQSVEKTKAITDPDNLSGDDSNTVTSDAPEEPEGETPEGGEGAPEEPSNETPEGEEETPEEETGEEEQKPVAESSHAVNETFERHLNLLKQKLNN